MGGGADRRGENLRAIVELALIIVIILVVSVFDPKTTSDPAASPQDKANEDLSRYVSHGCVGLFDEYMQHRTYGVPEKPVLNDAKILYAWTIGGTLFAIDDGSEKILADTVPFEIFGDLPAKLSKTQK